jgi:DNA-binding NarL/FixJ family response regulator
VVGNLLGLWCIAFSSMAAIDDTTAVGLAAAAVLGGVVVGGALVVLFVEARWRRAAAPPSAQAQSARAAGAAPAKDEDVSVPPTRKEIETLLLVARGLTNKEIAAKLCISEAGVAKRMLKVYDKLDLKVRERNHAVFRARQMGWLGERDGGE